MNRFLDLDEASRHGRASAPQGTTRPVELGESLAHLTWESFSDEVVSPELRQLLSAVEVPSDDGPRWQHVVEELLIVILWAHTRTLQLSLVDRAPAEVVRDTLDAMHRALFEDMVEHGTPRAQLPLFEQRVGARYTEYYGAAEESDDRVGEVAAGHLMGTTCSPPEAATRYLTERLVMISGPLRDFLDDVEVEG
jgi:hypothetical protein